MAYNEALAQRLRQKLMHLPDVEEKEMFGGIVFMVNAKMCMGVFKQDLMARINPNILESLKDIDGWQQMTMGGMKMSGYILVSEDVINQNNDLDFWIKLALDFNPLAKALKKKKVIPKH
jgi:TfoX/Sxy family transcriptional regulator of competence genes